MPSLSPDVLAAFFKAAKEGDAQVVQRLLLEDPLLAKERNKEDNYWGGLNALEIVARSKSEQSHRCLEVLLPLSDIGDLGEFVQRTVMAAIQTGQAQHVRTLLTVPGVATTTVREGKTAFLWACEMVEEDCVRELLPYSDAKARMNDGSNALHCLAGHSREWGPESFSGPASVRILDLLLEAGVDPLGKTNNGETPLLRAASHRGRSQLIAALQNVCDVHAVDQKGRTPLMLTACFPGSNIEQLRVVLNASDPQAMDLEGWTALMHATDAPELENMRLLVRYSDVAATNHAGKDALAIAIDAAKAWGFHSWNVDVSSVSPIQREALDCVDLLTSVSGVQRMREAMDGAINREAFPLTAARWEREVLAWELARGTPPSTTHSAEKEVSGAGSKPDESGVPASNEKGHPSIGGDESATEEQDRRRSVRL